MHNAFDSDSYLEVALIPQILSNEGPFYPVFHT